MEKLKAVAYSGTGRRVERTITGATLQQAKEMLWADGLHIVSIHPPALRVPSLEEAFPSVVRVRRNEVILFTRELATFVRVGMPMLEGLGILRDQTGSGLMRRAIDSIMSDLTSGSPLSAALARNSRVFSRLYVDMIASAEVSGNLDDTLTQLAGYMSRDESALRKVRNAMIYPAIVLALALAVIGVLIGFVLPSFARLFSDFHAQLPLPTRVLLATGIFARDHMVPIFAVLGVAIATAVAYSQTGRGRDRLDEIVLKLPLIGVMVRFSIVERYLRTLATLARAGVPITQMLDTATQSVGNAVFRRGLRSIRDQMLSGDGFARPLQQTELFPRMVIQIVKVGEETGHLDSNLEQAADHYAEEVDYRLKRMISLLEPALVLVVGAMVGFIAISVIAPMYSLVSAIH